MKDNCAEIMALTPLRLKWKQCRQIVTETTFLSSLFFLLGKNLPLSIFMGIYTHVVVRLGTQYHYHGHPEILCLILPRIQDPGNILPWPANWHILKTTFIPVV